LCFVIVTVIASLPYRNKWLKYIAMCGIVCAFDLKQKSGCFKTASIGNVQIIRHRGPDWSGIYSNDKAIMSHERLAIVDPASGKQPYLVKMEN
jgi:asparagine synthase (glutamine-hydrolysing)